MDNILSKMLVDLSCWGGFAQ